MNKLGCLIVLLILCRISSAQTPDWIWARHASAETHESFVSVYDNSVYVAGSFWGDSIVFDSITLFNIDYTLFGINFGYPDIFIAKYDTSGNIIWAKRAGGIGEESIRSMRMDNLGNIYLGGRCVEDTLAFGSDTLIFNNGYYHFLILKFDSNGNELFARSDNCGSLPTGAEIYGVSSDSANNLYAEGFFNPAPLIINTDTLISHGATDIFIIKYDSNGNKVWVKSFGGTGFEMYGSIVTSPAGESYVTATYDSPFLISNNDTVFNHGDKDFFVSKYDANGNLLWTQGGGGSFWDWEDCISIDSSENVFVSGHFWSTDMILGNDTLISNYYYNPFIVKFDTDGTILWARCADANAAGIPFGIFNDNSGKTCIAGQFESDSINFGGSNILINNGPVGSGYHSIFLVEYDQYGNVLWNQGADGTFYDEIASVCSDNSNNIYVTGYISDTIVFGTDTLTTPFQDLFVAKLGQPINVTSPEFKNNEEFVIFPNPFSDKINMMVKNNKLVEVNLFDVTARKILKQSFTNSTSINTEQLAKGIYLYEVRNKNGVSKEGKVVKD